MNLRDARLRNELIGIVVLKICLLAVLWLVFVHGSRVPVDIDAMAKHAANTTRPISANGGPNGH